MSDTQIVFLGQKGEIRQGKLKSSSLAGIATAFKKKDVPSLLGKFIWKQKVLFLFGYVDGKASQENQHHLPAPLEGMTFYGDILVLASADPNSYAKPVSLKTTEYETFYTTRLEGEDEEMIEDEEEEEEVIEEIQEEEEEENFPVEEVQEEEEEEEEVPVEKPIRKSKKIIIAAVEEPEILLTESASVPQRQTVLKAITKVLGTALSEKEQESLEYIIFRTAFEHATKEEMRISWSSQFQEIYLATARRIVGNLDPNSYIKNNNLWNRYSNKELTLEQIAKQNYYELCPEKWDVMVDKQAKREHIQLEGDFSRATEKWLCNGCKTRKCTYYELQTRSADEPMTIFIHCLNCGKRWTQ